ncbi:DUF1569 domain-containing protein [Acidipila sp. EB88]|uniref:DUF1569 domain-containing protein n=1 Tax=Acidipila sp. EB88 TaxID=2305226 RepID=UPI000F5F7DCA|nr:DUF1569 domain-containing protein [Acidipila sp. EB88]RRA48598.1 hypothetical protein D1Y84_10160 [Acidipila sp. EB88]
MRTLANPADLAEIVQRLHLVVADDPALWGVMNAAEMLCHLRGAFRVAMGEIEAAPVEVPMPRAVLKFAALWTEIPWRRNFATVPALKRGTAVMQAGPFESDRAEVLLEMRRFCQPEQRRVDHSFFGPMSPVDWMRWGYLHTDHHLRQFGR